MPRRLNNLEADLTRRLGDFLVEQGQIEGVDLWRGSWGFKYEARKIFVSEYPMPPDAYYYYIFRLGEDFRSGELLFPNQDEADRYRFLHEVGHAYQQNLTENESPDNLEAWYTRAKNGEINSWFGLLFQFCLNQRLRGEGRGLSTWGNVGAYNQVEDPLSQAAVRAIEDANELVVMYLWHPDYFRTFLDYLTGRVPGFGPRDVANDGLLILNNDQRSALIEVVVEFVFEMKRRVT